MSDIKKSVETVKRAWISSSYYNDAEKWTFLFWENNSIFKQYFDKLDVRFIAELACGYGRHAEKLLQTRQHQVQLIYCLDVVEENLLFTENRLAVYNKSKILLVSGHDFKPIASNSLTSIFCYDAMVHFSPDIIESYLIDAYRVLTPNGRALFHHSNLNAPETGQPGRDYGGNPHARNHMTLELFETLARKAGLRILQTNAIRWGNEPDLDRITLLERPAF
jgi:SAM-dependent methyltransferase